MRETLATTGTLGGLSELAHPSHIPQNDFVTATNVENIGGTLRPRPGYSFVVGGAVAGDSTAVVTPGGGVLPKYLAADLNLSDTWFLYSEKHGGACTVRWCGYSGSGDAELLSQAQLFGSTDLRSLRFLLSGTTKYVFAVDPVLQSLIRLTITGTTTPSATASLIYVFPGNRKPYACAAGYIQRLDATTGLYDTVDIVLVAVYNSGTTETEIHGFNVDGTGFRISSGIHLTQITGVPPFTGTGAPGDIEWSFEDAILWVTNNNDPEAAGGNALIYRKKITATLAASGDISTGTTAYTDGETLSAIPKGLYYSNTERRLYYTSRESSGTDTGVWSAEVGTNAELSNHTQVTAVATTYAPIGVAVLSDGTRFFCDFGSTASVRRIAAAERILGGYWWTHDVVGTNTAADVVLLQYLNVSNGGSQFRALFPFDNGTLITLSPQYSQGSGGSPDIFVMPDRDADGSGTDPIFATGSMERASYVFQGKGLDSHQGGVLFAGAGAFAFNWHTGEAAANESQKLAISGGPPTAGTFTLTALGNTTSAIAWNATPATIATALQTAVGTGTWTGGGSNFTVVDGYVTITLSGGLANRGIPFITSNSLGLTVAAGNVPASIVTTDTDTPARGQQHSSGILWLIPAGLPRPTITSATGANVTNGALNGVYDYVMTYHSSRLNLESPPSAVARGTTAGAAGYVNLDWTNPSTRWFSQTYGNSVYLRPVIDYVRIYRKRRGNTLVSGEPDGNGADTAYKFVDQVSANQNSYRDNKADEETLEDTAPTDKEYPPDDAQYVEIHDQRAFYVQSAAGTKLVWFTPASPIVGSVADGELTYTYVPPDANFEISDLKATDHGISAIRSFGGQLCVWTDQRLFAVETSDVDFGPPSVRPIEGAVGCASHWCVVESNPLPEDGGVLFYPHPTGGMYRFDGVRTVPIAREDIKTSLDGWSRRTWIAPESNNADLLNSWYYASAVADPQNNRLILAAPLANGSTETYVYSLDVNKWTKWTIGSPVWIEGRNTGNGSDALDPTPYLAQTSSLYYLRPGYTDAGAPFSWVIETGKQSAGIPASSKQWHDGVILADRVGYGGDSPTVTIVTKLDDQTVTTGMQDLRTTGDAALPFAAKGHRGRMLALNVSGTVSMDLDEQPRIYGWAVQWAREGTRLRVKQPETT